MSTIGGPGGIGGPKGPGGPDGPSQIDDLDDVAGEAPIGQARGAPQVGGPSELGGLSGPGEVTDLGDIEALASEVAAGRLTPREAIDRLVDATAGPELGATERAELRELLSDLVAHDPYLAGLIGRI